jgi:toxin ParE1/3/4
MAQIIWTEPAVQELDEIADYISLDNPNLDKARTEPGPI